MSQLFEFHEKESVILPEGHVLVIDPCYVFDELETMQWDDFCSGYFESENQNGATVFCYKGVDILISRTAHGDGIYEAKSNLFQRGSFSVDAGMFCFIPYSETVEKAPELISFFNPVEHKDGSISFDPENACVLECQSGMVVVLGDGYVEGVINVDTQ